MEKLLSTVFEQYLDHSRRYPAEVLEEALDGMLARAEWSDIGWDAGPEVARRIKEAIETRQPFSMIRVGDGTGNFLGYADAAYAGLRDFAREAILEMTFGTSDFSVDEIGQIRDGLVAGIASADILGVSDLFRLGRLRMIDRNLHESPDVRGYSGSRESYVAVHDLLVSRAIRPAAIVTNHIHRFLAQHIDDILDGVKSVCVIGPYNLEDRLKTRHNFETVSSYLIPNQNSTSGEGRRWFPNLYQSLSNQVDPARDGQVYLLAAGLLAKPLAAQIKARGGIALDIGSLIDVWAGRAVRKYHDDEFVRAHSLQADCVQMAAASGAVFS